MPVDVQRVWVAYPEIARRIGGDAVPVQSRQSPGVADPRHIPAAGAAKIVFASEPDGIVRIYRHTVRRRARDPLKPEAPIPEPPKAHQPLVHRHIHGAVGVRCNSAGMPDLHARNSGDWLETAALESGEARKSAYPKRAVSADVKVVDIGSGETVSGAETLEPAASIAIQAVLGAHPEEPGAVLGHAVNCQIIQARFLAVAMKCLPLRQNCHWAHNERGEEYSYSPAWPVWHWRKKRHSCYYRRFPAAAIYVSLRTDMKNIGSGPDSDHVTFGFVLSCCRSVIYRNVGLRSCGKRHSSRGIGGNGHS